MGSDGSVPGLTVMRVCMTIQVCGPSACKLEEKPGNHTVVVRLVTFACHYGAEVVIVKMRK